MNLADARSVRKAKQVDRLNRQRELDDLRAVASTFQGRRFLKRILDQTGMFGLYFDGANQGINAFYEGLRSLGVVVFNDLTEVDAALYPAMLREAKNEQAQKPADDEADILYHPKSNIVIPKQEDDDDARDDT